MVRATDPIARLIREISAEEIAFLLDAKKYLRAHDFDEVAIIFLIASQNGISEREISETLSITHSTTNRIINLMLRSKKILVTGKGRPRRFIYNRDFSHIAYGPMASDVRREFYLRTFIRRGQLSADLISNLMHAQFEKPEKS